MQLSYRFAICKINWSGDCQFTVSAKVFIFPKWHFFFFKWYFRVYDNCSFQFWLTLTTADNDFETIAKYVKSLPAKMVVRNWNDQFKWSYFKIALLCICVPLECFEHKLDHTFELKYNSDGKKVISQICNCD